MRRRYAWLQPWRLPMALLVTIVVVGVGLVLATARLDVASVWRTLGYVAIVWGVLGVAGRLLVQAAPIPGEPRD